MPKAFSEVPKRIHSAGRREINRLKNQRRELLVHLDGLRIERRLLSRDKNIVTKLLKEYQGKGESCKVITKEHDDEVKAMQDTLKNLKSDLCDKRLHWERVDANIMRCTTKIDSYKKLQSLDRKLESLDTLENNLKKSRENLKLQAEMIKEYQMKVNQLIQQHKREADNKDREIKILKEKCGQEMTKLEELKIKIKQVTKRMEGTNHHFRSEDRTSTQSTRTGNVMNRVPNGGFEKKKVKSKNTPSSGETRNGLPGFLPKIGGTLHVSRDSSSRSLLEKDDTHFPDLKFNRHSTSPLLNIHSGEKGTIKSECGISNLSRSSGISLRSYDKNSESWWSRSTSKPSSVRENPDCDEVVSSSDQSHSKTASTYICDKQESTEREENVQVMSSNVVTDDEVLEDLKRIDIGKQNDEETKKKRPTTVTRGSRHCGCFGEDNHRNATNMSRTVTKSTTDKSVRMKTRKVYIFQKAVEHLHDGRPTKSIRETSAL